MRRSSPLLLDVNLLDARYAGYDAPNALNQTRPEGFKGKRLVLHVLLCPRISLC